MKRIAEVIQRELAVILHKEAVTSQNGLVSISGVKVTKDIAHAIVFITLLNAEDDNIEDTLELLNRNAAYLRTLLAKRLTFKTIPRLSFRYDATHVEGVRISQLIDQALTQ